MAAEQSPLFTGLVRPPKLIGLPIMYAMVWLFGSVLLFLWIQHWAVAIAAAAAYPALWKAADWDPNFLDVVATDRKPSNTRERQLCPVTTSKRRTRFFRHGPAGKDNWPICSPT